MKEAFFATTLCRASYGGVESFKSDTSAPPDKVIPFELDNAQAYFVCYDDVCWLVFRGSDEKKDWLNNIEIAPKQFNSIRGKIHSGFYRHFRKVKHALLCHLASSDYRKLFITGHSLGGAAATLAAYVLHTSEIPIEKVYTFGAPKVGNSTFANDYNEKLLSKTYRFVNSNDIVPQLLRSYTHVGRRVYINDSGQLSIGVGSAFSWLVDQAKGLLKFLTHRKFEPVRDHMVGEYCDALRDAPL